MFRAAPCLNCETEAAIDGYLFCSDDCRAECEGTDEIDWNNVSDLLSEAFIRGLSLDRADIVIRRDGVAMIEGMLAKTWMTSM